VGRGTLSRYNARKKRSRGGFFIVGGETVWGKGTYKRKAGNLQEGEGLIIILAAKGGSELLWKEQHFRGGGCGIK